MARNPKNVKPDIENLTGFTQKQLNEHFDVLYKGYVNKINEIEEKLKSASPSEANATYSNFRALKTEEVFTENAIRLHEGYFESLGKGSKPQGPIENLIKEDFGSVEKWEEEFKGLGLAARGWVVLAFDLETRKLKNFLTDFHSIGVWNAIPLLILDVYEHAYFIDYGTARKKYIESYFANIDWNTVNARVKKFKIEEFRKEISTSL
ncbi:MAG: superoxide dismutase [Planctomycetota bacterium]